MDTGTKISGLAHAGLILWVMLAGVFSSGESARPAMVSDVSLISAEEFAALTAPAQVPAPATEPEPAPEPAPEPEPAPAPEPEPEAPEPEPEAAPEPAPQPLPFAPDTPPAPAAPDAALSPLPRPADRVAPEPTPAPPEEAAPDDTTREAIAPEPAPEAPTEVVEEPAPATAPEAATTQIITEATETDEQGGGAPLTSPRPQVRPERPTPTQTAATDPEPAPTPTPSQPQPEPDRDAIAEALAAAVNVPQNAPVAPAAPTGGTLSAGERDSLRLAVQQCWNVGGLSTDALNVTVTVAFSMNRDGRPDVSSLRMAGANGGTGGAVERAYEAARRAILRCGADGFDLPPEKYDAWRDIEMVFNPESMRIR